MTDELERVQPEDLAFLTATNTDLQRANQGVQRAQQSLLMAQGAAQSANRFVHSKYRIEDGDSLDPRTGVITRAPKPVDPQDPETWPQNGHKSDAEAVQEVGAVAK